MPVIAHAGPESFWQLNPHEPLPESAANYWVGAAPRLGTPDGAARYAFNSDPGDALGASGVAVKLAPFAWPNPEGVRITTQVRLSPWNTASGFVVLGFLTDSAGSGWPMLTVARSGIWDQVEVPADGDWHIVSVDLAPFAPSTWQPEAAAAGAAGELWVYATANPASAEAFGISWLQVETLGAAIPLRLRQRGDGLGMGGPRVRGVGSRQGSPRVRGYV